MASIFSGNIGVDGVGFSASQRSSNDVESDSLGNKIDAEDFEIIEDIELNPCDSTDEENERCDFDNEELTIEVMYTQ